MTTLPDLSGFIGSERVFRHALNRNILFTEGVNYLAKKVGAYWLIDEIALSRRTEGFQVWKLMVNGSQATLLVEDGDDRQIWRKKIAFTDFPEPGITLWCVNHTIMLPSEY
jgi:hypothetical protein